MQLQREKGLCYTCDAKFSPSHSCPNKHLMLFHCEEEEPPNIDEASSAQVEATLYHFSVNALQGTHLTYVACLTKYKTILNLT